MPANRDQHQPRDEQQVAVARRRARRTALLVAGIAVAVYVGFIVSGVLNQQ